MDSGDQESGEEGGEREWRSKMPREMQKREKRGKETGGGGVERAAPAEEGR